MIMKTILFHLTVVATVALAMPTTASAQLSNILSDVKEKTSSSSSSSGLVSGLVSGLLGKNKLTVKNLAYTWTYTEPCIVLESDNVLGKIGGAVATDKIEDAEKSLLEKVGFTAGKVVLTLKDDNTGTMTIGGKDQSIKWDVDESDLVLTLGKKDIKMNASISGNTLQLAMSIDKLLDVLEAVCSGVGSISSLGSVLNSLVSMYAALYLGLQFS